MPPKIASLSSIMKKRPATNNTCIDSLDGGVVNARKKQTLSLPVEGDTTHLLGEKERQKVKSTLERAKSSMQPPVLDDKLFPPFVSEQGRSKRSSIQTSFEGDSSLGVNDRRRIVRSTPQTSSLGDTIPPLEASEQTESRSLLYTSSQKDPTSSFIENGQRKKFGHLALRDERLTPMEVTEQRQHSRSSLCATLHEDALSPLRVNEQRQNIRSSVQTPLRGDWIPPLEECEQRQHSRSSLRAYPHEDTLSPFRVNEQRQTMRSSVQTPLQGDWTPPLEAREQMHHSLPSLRASLHGDTLSSIRVNEQRQNIRSSVQTPLRDDCIPLLEASEQRQHSRSSLRASLYEDTPSPFRVNEQRHDIRSSVQTPLRGDRLPPSEVDEQRQNIRSSMQAPMLNERAPLVADDNTCRMKKRSTRGRTTLKVVVPMNGKKHKCYIFEDGRIVGPGRRKLSSFLGILACNYCLFPIHKEWGLEHESAIKRVMVDVHCDYDFFNKDGTPLLLFGDVINFVKKTINQQLRDFRALLKSKLDPHIPIVEQVQPLDNRVPPDHWLSLIDFWSKETKMLEACRNKRSRSVLHGTHTSGQISFGERQDKAEKDGASVPIVQTYLNSHKKKNGEYISEKMKEICEKIELRSRELGEEKAKQPLEFISMVDDAHGSHHGGYERGFSGGITRRNLKKKMLVDESNRIATTAWKLQLEDRDNQIKEKDHQIKEKERELEILRAKIKSLECQGMSSNTEFNCHTTPHALDEPYDPLTSYQVQRSPTHYRASGTSKRVLGPNIRT